jgi:TRAP transporter TAXI family solute receptor
MLAAVFLVVLLWAPFNAAGPRPVHAGESARLLRIGTGGLTGVYYPIGQALARGLTGAAGDPSPALDGESGIPGYIGVAQTSAGSVENARTVTRGDIEAGLVQADVAAQAYHGKQAFVDDAAARSIRAVASLYPERLQIVTRRDAAIRNIGDFPGKRISIDEIGSGTLAVMRIVLAAQGVTEADFSPVYLKPMFTQDKMTNGELQGFAMMAGTPMDAVTRLSAVDLFLVPIPPAIAARIHAQFPYLVPGVIPEGVYRDIPATPTLQVHALLVVGASLEESLVYRATAALWSQRTAALLAAGHPQGRSISLETSMTGISIPLHPGAERYYRHIGVLR